MSADSGEIRWLFVGMVLVSGIPFIRCEMVSEGIRTQTEDRWLDSGAIRKR